MHRLSAEQRRKCEERIRAEANGSWDDEQLFPLPDVCIKAALEARLDRQRRMAAKATTGTHNWQKLIRVYEVAKRKKADATTLRMAEKAAERAWTTYAAQEVAKFNRR